MKKYLTHFTVLAFILNASILFSQGYKPLYFRLSPAEAEYLYRNPTKAPDSSFFHSEINQIQAEKENGHYLLVSPEGESAEISLHTTSPIRLQVLNNRYDLSILVKDTLGQNLSNAKVLIGRTTMPYDNKTQTFRIKRASKTSLLEIKMPDYSTYFQLERYGHKPIPILYQYDRFSYSRVGHILTWPLGILIEPIRYISRSIRSHHWYLPWRYGFRRKNNQQLGGYIALSQPIYRLGDTLRMKAYVTSPKGRVLRTKLQLELTQQWREKVLSKTIEPEKPGVYILDLPLLDTLDIDKNYQLNLTHPDHEQWSDLSQSFRLEEYELEEINYTLQASTTSFQRQEKCILSLSAKTTNGLSVPDAEAEVFLLSGEIQEFYADKVELPDTLWHSKERLGVRGEWSVVLPDSLIPALSMKLLCHVYFNNSAGQMAFKEQTIRFLDQPDFKLSLKQEEIFASSNTNHRDSLTLETQFAGGEKHLQRIQLPLRFPLDPNVESYALLGKDPKAKLELSLQNEESQVKIEGQRSLDSVQLRINNPRKLPLWYQIKTSTGLVEEGFIKDSIWNWQKKAPGANAYHLYYQYLWAGKIFNQNREFRSYPKELTIEMDGPTRVIPGQENSYQLRVSRSSGRPAKGVDLSVGATNAQFGDRTSYSIPDIGFRRQMPPRAFPSFALNPAEEYHTLPMTRLLTYIFHLQDSLYYKYRYTSQFLSEHRDSSMRRDSFYQSVAQFAPFLVKGGKMQPIYLIYANRKLIYYYGTQDNCPYSFIAPAGKSQIVLRTRDCEYILDSVQLRRGEKLELVINEDYRSSGLRLPNVQRIAKTDYLSVSEKNWINQSILAIQSLQPQDSIFIWDQFQNIHLATYRSGNHYLVGPFVNGSTLTYLKMNRFKSSFVFEPGFSYSVEKNRERLYEYKALPDLKKAPILPKSIPLPKIGQYVISPKSVRASSPPRNSISFSQVNIKDQKFTGKYQFSYTFSDAQADSQRLSLIVLRNLANAEKWYFSSYTRSINNLPSGNYELLLFNQVDAVFRKNIKIRRDTLLFEAFSSLQFYRIDSLLPSLLGRSDVPLQLNNSTGVSYTHYFGSTNRVEGRVLDKDGLPLIGASVLVAGTTIGTVTDIDGFYSIDVPTGYHPLVVSYTGFASQEFLFNERNYASANVVLNEQGSALREVVVTGYSTTKTRNLAGTVALTEGRVAGVGTRESASRPPTYYLDGISIGPKLMDTISASGIRSSFHDHAIWQPRLRSNRYGEAQFKVKFPDDITNWKTFVIGADKKQQAGFYTGNIQSYKPLMAQLALPRFLIHGDQTTLNGKVLNYTSDTFALQTHFQAGEQRIYDRQNQVIEGLVEKTEFQAPVNGNSIQLSYALETAKGYTDGEQRTIPLLPIGTLEADGAFLLIERDTVLHFGDKNGQLRFHAQPSILALLLEDIQYLRDYPYACNEQTASKLIGLLSEKQIRKTLNQPFGAEKMIRDAVIRLSKAQNPDGSWGWWPQDSANVWMSNYVLRALYTAQQAGYPNIAFENGMRWLVNQVPAKDENTLFQTLQTFFLVGQKFDSQEFLDTLAKPRKSLYNRLISFWIQQELGLKPSLDTLFKYRKLDAFGGSFWEEELPKNGGYQLNNNRIATTLLAYQIAKKAGLSEELKRIRLHLFANRGYINHGLRTGHGWLNTLEVASILQNIIPDLLKNNSLQVGSLQLSGALEAKVDKQALDATFNANTPLKLSVKGTGPFFCTAYQESWNTNPAPKSDLFAVSSHLETAGEPVKFLQFGKAAQLIAEVDVKQEGQYVMIEIPIPAGCSYGEKTNGYRYPEVHREYFPEKVSIFCEKLPIGQHRFAINLESRFSGTYTLNPVRVEEMYFPVLYGRNGVETVKIKP
jgi:hypothetical protein